MAELLTWWNSADGRIRYDVWKQGPMDFWVRGVRFQCNGLQTAQHHRTSQLAARVLFERLVDGAVANKDFCLLPIEDALE